MAGVPFAQVAPVVPSMQYGVLLEALTVIRVHFQSSGFETPPLFQFGAWLK
jgi:hypothetical protein